MLSAITYHWLFPSVIQICFLYIGWLAPQLVFVPPPGDFPRVALFTAALVHGALHESF